MDYREFAKACQPWNIAYRDMFHCIPDPADYHCTREQFLQALQHAVVTKAPIEDLLKDKIVTRSNTQFLY